MPAGFGYNCVMICSSTGLPRHSHNTGGAVQGSGYICRVAGSWRAEGEKSIVYNYILIVLMMMILMIVLTSTSFTLGVATLKMLMFAV